MNQRSLWQFVWFFSFVWAGSISGFAQAGGETCASATVISNLPFVGIGSTSGAVDDYFASCPDYPNSGGAPDHVYVYTNGLSPQYVDLSLCIGNSNYDTQLYIYEGSCTGNPVACQEDGCQSPAFSAPYNSAITAFLMQPATTYYIVIDGFDAGAAGNYQLDVGPAVGIQPPDSTRLPLFLIDTRGQTIVDEPKIEAELNKGLAPARDLPQVRDVRCLGAIGVVELHDPVDMQKVQPLFVEAGIWVRPFGKLVYVMPSFIMESTDVGALTQGMLQVLDQIDA